MTWGNPRAKTRPRSSFFFSNDPFPLPLPSASRLLCPGRFVPPQPPGSGTLTPDPSRRLYTALSIHFPRIDLASPPGRNPWFSSVDGIEASSASSATLNSRAWATLVFFSPVLVSSEPLACGGPALGTETRDPRGVELGDERHCPLFQFSLRHQRAAIELLLGRQPWRPPARPSPTRATFCS